MILSFSYFEQLLSFFIDLCVNKDIVSTDPDDEDNRIDVRERKEIKVEDSPVNEVRNNNSGDDAEESSATYEDRARVEPGQQDHKHDSNHREYALLKKFPP